MNKVREEINECTAKALVKNDFYFLNLARNRAKKYYEFTPSDLMTISKYEDRLKDEIDFIKFELANEHFNGRRFKDNIHGVKLF